jgi:hypothetical protein
MHFAVLSADRDVFAWAKGMCAEPVARLVVLLGGRIIVEDPAGMLRAARLVDEAADFVVLAGPEPPYAAMLAVCAPLLDVDMAGGVERCDKFLAVTLGACRELFRAGEVEPNALERMR